MPPRHDRAAPVIAMRQQAEPVPFSEIGRRLGITTNAAIGLARRAGLQDPARNPTRPRETPRPPPPELRDPLPAGHPEAWGLINAGTCLAGVAYPDRDVRRAA